MKAVVYEQYGAPDVLHLKEVAKPIPKDNEVLINIRATTASTGDVNARGFTFVPPGMSFVARLMFGFTKPKKAILGTDFAGEVEAVGKDISQFKVGDRVFGVDGNGMAAYAEYKVMPEDGALTHTPDNLSYEQAVALLFGGSTAYYFLKIKGKIQKGQRVLVNGASGSVGSSAVQLAKHFGAEVTGVCSGKNADLVTSLGADKVIDYTQEDFRQNAQAYDLIVDTVVGEISFARCKNSLTQQGYYLAVAGGIGTMLHMQWARLFSRKNIIFGGGLACERKEYLVFLKELAEAGAFKPVIDRCYPLEQIVEAHRYVDTGRKKGNVVIKVS